MAPAAKVRVTKNAIDYANSVAKAELEKELENIQMADQSGNDHHLRWSVENIQKPGVSLQNSALSLTNNGLSWTLSDLCVELKSDWKARYKKGKWLSISDSGSVRVKIQHVNVSVTVALGMDETNRPSIKTTSCNVHIEKVGLDFHGGTAFIWNLFSGILEHRLKSLLHDKIHDVVSKEINEGAAGKLALLKVMVEIDNRFLLDYSLTAAPTITEQYLEVHNKGQVYWKNAVEEAPFSPGVIPPSSDVSRMLYLWLTEYVFNTYLYVAHTHDYLKVNLVPRDEILQWVHMFIPQIGTVCQDKELEINLVSKYAPQFTITTEGIKADLCMDIKLDGKSHTGETVNLLTITANLYFSMTPMIQNERLVGTLANDNLTIEDVKTPDGSLFNVLDDRLNLFMNAAVKIAVLPEVNRLAARGIDLPMTGRIKFQNATLSLLPGVLLLATDLLYES